MRKLDEVLKFIKNSDEMNVVDDILVVVTSTEKGRRETITFNPEGSTFIDRHARIGFGQCYVIDSKVFALSEDKGLCVLLIDLDRQSRRWKKWEKNIIL